MSSPPTVLISGGGPAGLLLGHSLKKANIPFRIFERDAAVAARPQGYRFRITGEGVRALQSNLSPSHFALVRATCAIVEGEFSFGWIDAFTGEKESSPPAGQLDMSIEPLCADRTTFRQVLARGLEAELEFGKEVTGSTIEPDGVCVQLSSGERARGAVLVAADGAWSRIRQQHRPQLVPVDTEARWVYGKTAITAELAAAVDSRLLQGMQLVKDSSAELPVALLSESMKFSTSAATDVELPQDYIYWVLGARSDRFDTSALPRVPSSDTCAALSKELTATWRSGLRALFELQNKGDASLLRIPSMKPPLPAWEPSRVVLIGDAAHCMSPTGGQGATTSLMDAALLGELFAQGGASAESIGKYEAKMREYADKAITISRFGGVKFIGMKEFEDLRPFESNNSH